MLVDVVADGFVLYCCGKQASPTALVASYEWHHWVDLITTARVPILHRGQVDVFAPEVVVWAYEGPPQLALRAMLELVHPAHPLRPLPPIGRVELSGFVGEVHTQRLGCGRTGCHSPRQADHDAGLPVQL